jgi:hypothetical protein
MTITELRHALEPFGWRFDGVNLTSPSGGFWVSESMLASPMQVYLPVARRRELVLRESLPGAKEYEDLLAALEADPEVWRLASRVRALASIVRPWAAEHGATVSLWDFSPAAVRTEARHPAGGIACIECEVLDAAQVTVTALHWCDDHASGVRRSWKQSLRSTELSAASLTARLDHAMRVLLEPREMTSYSPLP